MGVKFHAKLYIYVEIRFKLLDFAVNLIYHQLTFFSAHITTNKNIKPKVNKPLEHGVQDPQAAGTSGKPGEQKEEEGVSDSL